MRRGVIGGDERIQEGRGGEEKKRKRMVDREGRGGKGEEREEGRKKGRVKSRGEKKGKGRQGNGDGIMGSENRGGKFSSRG